jgi:tRNA-specific 2-thiouridylase
MKSLRVAVAMSGGVDSSVAAALLTEQGHDVFGLMMRLWSADPEGFNRCCSPQDVIHARHVADILGIGFHVLDCKEAFKNNVVDAFIDGYAKGFTPNPCLECNRSIRWGFLIDQALQMGASHMATGHYAQIIRRSGRFRLMRAKDLLKDQSYVLHMLDQIDLSRTLFPLGNHTKEEVRALARNLHLPVADRPDSQDLCFVTDEDYRSFLRNQQIELPPPGQIVDHQGSVLGRHEGLASFTIGQRKGIRISSPEPLYVLAKDLTRNRLVVGSRRELERSEFNIHRLSWIRGKAPSPRKKLLVRVRYQAEEVPAHVHPLTSSSSRVILDSPLTDVTPGQAAVFYHEDECLGGGIIQS